MISLKRHYSDDGIIQVIDEDRLCYLVKSTNKGVTGIRTIPRNIVDEYIAYIKKHPNCSSQKAREDLKGKTDIDRFEYGYSATILKLAQMVLKNSNGNDKNIDNSISIVPHQLIFFGAPGTGKSYAVNAQVGDDDNPYTIRTTFHPDSDYSTFVGCYKPTKKENNRKISIIPADELIEQAKVISKVANQIQFLCDNADSIIPASEEKGVTTNKLIWELFGWHNETYFVSIMKTILDERSKTDDSEITYSFVPQAFTKAYVAAWKDPNKQYNLVIEEINRGNCAQIFGDIFQLLDRNASGESDYAISPDNDLQEYLGEVFAGSGIADDDIRSGKKMKLPSNLSIYATMNTSDQSLFPIDSAFKRRWDWKYIPINKDEDGHYIECGNEHYDWWDFLEKVNPKIDSTTGSEDKQLGFWFAKPEENDGKISAEKFVSKVVFYLWNDVFKDYTTDGNNVFKTADGLLKFRQFFERNGKVNIDVLSQFLENLKVSKVDVASTDEPDEDTEEEDEEGNSTKDYTKYSINGDGSYAKRQIATELVKEYIKKNPTLTAEQVVEKWKGLGNLVSHFIETQSEYDSRTDKPRVNQLECNGSTIYVSTNGWGKKIKKLQAALEKQDWGLSIEQVK